MRRWTDKIIDDVAAWRRKMDSLIGSRVVLTNGCFDLLHVGHVELLQAARMVEGNGISLVVAVNSDSSVRELKGPTRPVVPEDQRVAVVASLESVDYCFLFHSKRCDAIIRAIRPNVWVKGGDYTLETLDANERAAAQAVGARIHIIPHKHVVSTTNILTRSQATPAS